MNPESFRAVNRIIEAAWTEARADRAAELAQRGCTGAASRRWVGWRFGLPLVGGPATGLILFAPFWVPSPGPRFHVTLLAVVLLPTAVVLLLVAADFHKDTRAARIYPVPSLYDRCGRYIVQRCAALGMQQDEVRYAYQLTRADRTFNVKTVENLLRYGGLVIGFVLGKVETKALGVLPALVVLVAVPAVIRWVLRPYLRRSLLADAIERHTRWHL